MISTESLNKEREIKISNLKAKNEKTLEEFKASKLKENEELFNEYSKAHDEIDNRVYKWKLELSFKNAYEALESKLNHRLNKYIKRGEIIDKNTLRNSKRVWEIDFLRGIAIWGMIIDHYIWNFSGIVKSLFKMSEGDWLSALASFSEAYYANDFRVFVRLFGVFLFVFLCGVSTRFSRKNIKRSLLIMGFGLVITLAGLIYSLVADETMLILMSTLFTIGFALFIYALSKYFVEKFTKKDIWKWVALGVFIISTIFWGVISSLNYLSLGHSGNELFRRFFYVFNNYGGEIGWDYGVSSITGDTWYKYFLGLRGFGPDWLGLFPYLNFIFLGGFVGETIYKDKKSIIKYFYHKEDRALSGEEYLLSAQGQKNAIINHRLRAISFPGRHTLFVYVMHQPIFFIIFTPIFLISGHGLILS